MKKLLIVGGVLVLVVAGIYFILPRSSPKPEPEKVMALPSQTPEQKATDIKASFSITTNGTKRIFTDPKYHNLSPDVYIQADNPGVIYVKKAGITWADFFQTLPMKLSSECLTTGTGQVFCTNEKGELRFLINGQPDQSILEKTIYNGDQLLVTYE